MRAICFSLSAVALVGCATPPAPSSLSPTPVVSSVTAQEAPGDFVLTRYELGTYRYPIEGQKNHEPAMYRKTRVSFRTTAGDREQSLDFAYEPPSFDPLPPSAELDAELRAQREITDKIRRAREAMADLEQQARNQYAALVAHTEETAQLGQHLETEYARLRELEARLQEKLHAASAPPTDTQSPVPASTPTQEIKW